MIDWDVCVTAAVFIVPASGLALASRRGIELRHILLLWPWAIGGGFAGAHLYYLLAAEGMPLSGLRLSDLGGVVSGTAVQGGMMGGLLALWAYSAAARVPLGGLLDVLAPGGSLAHAVSRLGCLESHCCFGRPFAAPIL